MSRWLAVVLVVEHPGYLQEKEQSVSQERNPKTENNMQITFNKINHLLIHYDANLDNPLLSMVPTMDKSTFL